MRRLGSGNAGGGAAVAGEWDGGGIAGRMRGVNTGIMDEKVLELVFRALNWDPRELCVVARVSRRLRAVAERVLWRELCVSRAPRMVSALSGPTAAVAAAAGRIGGGWPAMAKLLFFCCGAAGAAVPGHFAPVSRFSKTSGRSFLSRRCAGDLLFVSDPCEHAAGAASDDDVVGAYRGSTAAGLAPRSACRRLGANEGRLEYFVCVSGHLHGSCWLARLSSSSSSSDGERSADSDSNHSDDETFAAADVSLPLPPAGRVPARRLRGRPAM
uniref:F-box domain-containing protein n=1 Tax=Oryza barthii TaxID=65489 RepID=A0A0D3G9C1_9ORYZ